MNEKDILKIFEKEKAYLKGHFLLSSGLHSPNYMQCALVLQKPWVAEKLCKELAKKMRSYKIDTVIGPALGGMVVSYEMGRALKVKSIFAERVDGSFTLRRGFSVKKNERFLVVEDVITTGKSIYEVIDMVENLGGKISAVETSAGINGRFRVLVAEDPDEKKWPLQLKMGGGANGISLLKDVPVYYELWRNINGFPPDYYAAEPSPPKK